MPGVLGLSGPTAWQLVCRLTWSWKAWVGWQWQRKTRPFSLDALSRGILRSQNLLGSTQSTRQYIRKASGPTGKTTRCSTTQWKCHDRTRGWTGAPAVCPILVEPRPATGTGNGSSNCFRQRWRRWKAGASRWNWRLKIMICQKRVSLYKVPRMLDYHLEMESQRDLLNSVWMGIEATE